MVRGLRNKKVFETTRVPSITFLQVLMEKICLRGICCFIDLIGKGLVSYFLDFKKAFDMVPHEYFQRRMEEFKVPNEYMLCNFSNLQEYDMSCMYGTWKFYDDKFSYDQWNSTLQYHISGNLLPTNHAILTHWQKNLEGVKSSLETLFCP